MPDKPHRRYRLSDVNGNGLAYLWATGLAHAIKRYVTEFYPGRNPTRFAVDNNGTWSEM